MKKSEVIPFKKELSFIVKLVLSISVSTIVAILVLYKFLDKGLGNDYGNAFQIINKAYNNLDFYIWVVVFIQFAIVTVLVYFISLYFSHKIAGPMYRLKYLIEQYLQDKKVTSVKFRESDFLEGVGENFSHFFVYHNERTEKINQIKESLRKYKIVESEEERKAILENVKISLKELGE